MPSFGRSGPGAHGDLKLVSSQTPSPEPCFHRSRQARGVRRWSHCDWDDVRALGCLAPIQSRCLDLGGVSLGLALGKVVLGPVVLYLEMGMLLGRN